MYFIALQVQIKGTISVFSSEPPCKDARDSLPLKPLSDQNMEDCRLKVFNAVNSYMFPAVEMHKSLF